MVRSNRSHSFSVRRQLKWYSKNCNMLFNSRFSALKRFIWFRKFSRCLCFLILDLRADSRFDIILLRFRSSIFRFESFKTGFSFGSPEPELEVGLGLVGLKGEKMLGKFHDVKSSCNAVKSELEREESMVIAKVKSGERREGEREETLMKGLIFKDVLEGYSR
ncbi:hypothetical protein TSUD_231810 [Trifolium subterraneum]|uniref:Uncharacterized protein n=1 Tax=Trifolium subterraneum TaxID=3900 RepID=A0A2Z6LLM2_TRISU|nr:hypothetical protein TSUD_231810 [Trifolium subterraneum]